MNKHYRNRYTQLELEKLASWRSSGRLISRAKDTSLAQHQSGKKEQVT